MISRMTLSQFHSFTLENRRLGTIINSIARSFEKESYLNEVNLCIVMSELFIEELI